jgi:hypothetical protein
LVTLTVGEHSSKYGQNLIKKKKTKNYSKYSLLKFPRKELGVYISNTWGTFLQMWTQKIELVPSPNIIENVDQMKTY